MADITQILNQRMSRYERERARLVEEYVTAAWKMWQSLSPPTGGTMPSRRARRLT